MGGGKDYLIKLDKDSTIFKIIFTKLSFFPPKRFFKVIFMVGKSYVGIPWLLDGVATTTFPEGGFSRQLRRRRRRRRGWNAHRRSITRQVSKRTHTHCFFPHNSRWLTNNKWMHVTFFCLAKKVLFSRQIIVRTLDGIPKRAAEGKKTKKNTFFPPYSSISLIKRRGFDTDGERQTGRNNNNGNNEKLFVYEAKREHVSGGRAQKKSFVEYIYGKWRRCLL